MTTHTIRPLGDRAFTVEFGDAIDPALNARVRALDASLGGDPFPGLVECVPTYRSLLVVFDPSKTTSTEAAAEIHRREARALPEAPAGALHDVPVVYGGDDGPDLAAVAGRHGISPREVASRHAAGEYTVFMLGFVPGFAYLGLVDASIATPRLASPRPRVPAGSVGIAGRQTGVYPAASPGGWNLIGRTNLRLFDPGRNPPAVFVPGDRVRFRRVDVLPAASSFDAPAPPDAVGAGGHVLVEQGGLFTSIQDLGRAGWRRLGVGAAGAMDAPSLRLANRAVGNPPHAAGLECTMIGPRLRFLSSVSFAVTGADLGAVLLRDDLGEWTVPLGRAVRARPGNALMFSGRRTGCRAYVAFRGGIDAPVVLGSRSTDVGAGFGGLHGRALGPGDRLWVARDTPVAEPEAADVPPPADCVTLRVILGPQLEHLDASARARLLSEEFRVSVTSDRVGCRLEGRRLSHGGSGEIVSDGMVSGSIQVPPSGEPIVMMADAPTTGGYPKIATVIADDLPRLAQLVPGEGRVRFTLSGEGEQRLSLSAPREA